LSPYLEKPVDIFALTKLNVTVSIFSSPMVVPSCR
jgi:hypothetical protein